MSARTNDTAPRCQPKHEGMNGSKVQARCNKAYRSEIKAYMIHTKVRQGA